MDTTLSCKETLHRISIHVWTRPSLAVAQKRSSAFLSPVAETDDPSATFAADPERQQCGTRQRHLRLHLSADPARAPHVTDER